MPGHDWNGNGKTDAFDHFMDMKVMSSASNDDSDDLDLDIDIDDANEIADNDIDLHRAAVASALRNAQTNKAKRTESASTPQEAQASFQDELKKNMRTPEIVRQENAERERSFAMWEAKRTLETIKKILLQKVQNAEYTKKNGVTSVSCLCNIDHRYLRKKSYDNGEQLRQDRKKSFILRDPNLIYRTWDVFDVEPKYSSEYNSFMSALREIASKENISIETVINNGKNEIYKFPSTTERIYGYAQLCVRATTIIATDPNHKQSEELQANESTSVESMPFQAKQEDNESTITKSFLCIALCVLAFIICIIADMGKFGMALVMIGAAVLGFYIMRKK